MRYEVCEMHGLVAATKILSLQRAKRHDITVSCRDPALKMGKRALKKPWFRPTAVKPKTIGG
jgi:hypothetical protein